MEYGFPRLLAFRGIGAPLALAWLTACAAAPGEPPESARAASPTVAPRAGPTSSLESDLGDVFEDASESDFQSDDLATAFLSNPDYHEASLSPDGSRLAAIRSHGAEDRIVVLALDERGEAPSVVVRERRGDRGFEASRAITMLGWAGDEYLVYAIETAMRSPEDGIPRRKTRQARVLSQEQRGIGLRARKTRLYSTTLDGQSRYLGKRWQDAPYSQYQHEVIDWLPGQPHHILLGFEGKAVRVDVRNGGRLSLVREREKVSLWVADHAGTIRAGHSTRGWDRRLALHVRRSERDPWQTLSDHDAYRERGFRFAGFAPDPSRLYVYSDLESERAGLYEYDLERRALGPRVAAEQTRGREVVGLLQSSRDGRLLAVESCAGRCARTAVDPDFARAWKEIDAAFPGRGVGLVSRSRAEDRWLLQVASDVSPPELWLAEPASGRLTKLADVHPRLSGRTLSPMQTVRFRTRDGLAIEGYLTRPIDATGPGPVIVLPHDGPLERAYWGFDPVVQYLVARGFSVYQPNYRGSTGYGREFEQLGQGEWGGAIVRDVVDGARALVAGGMALPGQIGIYGEGFGGYLALQALVEAPDVFDAGACFGAVTDLPLMLSEDRRFVGMEAVDALLVVPASGGARALAAASPVNRADRIQAPVLLGHGTENPRYPEKHADAMEAALRRAGKPYESLRYEGATDAFLDDRHRIDFHRRLADFFERHLAGRRSAGTENAATESAGSGAG